MVGAVMGSVGAGEACAGSANGKGRAGFAAGRRLTAVVLWSLPAFFAALPSAGAETLATTEISAAATAVRSASAVEANVYALSAARLTFTSRGSAETKGQVTVGIKAGEAVLVDLEKAWVKARLGALRLTIGKTRLSWGEGALFNAGNVIFGSTDADLSAEDLRDDNAWLAAANFPLGAFSFIEAVVLPPVLGPQLAGPEDGSFGGRLYTRLAGVKLEAGWLRSGGSGADPAAGKPYLSLQGNAWADWHLSSSARFPESGGGSGGSPAMEDWTISSGLYRQWAVPAAPDGSGDSALGTLAVRLETLLRPAEAWAAEPIGAVPAASLPTGGTSLASPYALLLYPELSWRSASVLVLLRSLVSPVDSSARSAVVVQWAPLEGFKLIGNLSVQSGEEGDLFSWERSGAWQASFGTRFSF